MSRVHALTQGPRGSRGVGKGSWVCEEKGLGSAPVLRMHCRLDTHMQGPAAHVALCSQPTHHACKVSESPGELGQGGRASVEVAHSTTTVPSVQRPIPGLVDTQAFMIFAN